MSEEITIINNDLVPQGDEFSLEKLVKEFLNQHDVRTNSRDRYEKSLKQFLNYFKTKQVNQITRAAILEYKDSLLSSGKSPLTVSAYLVSVRLFYDYLNMEYNVKNIAKGIKVKRSKKFERSALTEEEAHRLLIHVKDNGNLRDFAIINLLLRTGIRTIESVRANISDVGEVQGKRCLYVHGKGRDNKKEYVLLTDAALDPLKEYIATRENVKPGDPLFISESNNNLGQRLTTKSISAIARNGLDAIGLNKREYTAHSLRHSAGSIMINQGISVERVREVLRHTNIDTTLGYVHKANEARRINESPESSLDSAF